MWGVFQFVWKTVLPYAGVAGMIASVALQISDYRNPKLAKILFVVSALVLLVPLLIGLPWPRIRQYAVENRVVSIITITLLGALVSAGAAIVFLPSKKSATESPMAAATATSTVKRVTIHDLFVTDFSLLSSNGEAETFPAASTGEKAVSTIEFKVWYDLESNAKFVSIYVPFSPDTFETLKAVAEQYNDILRARIQSITAPANPADATRMILAMRDSAFIGITFKNPGDSSTVNPLDFVSTGRIYLYYEYDLSLSQLGALENLFQSKGLSPQFRNWDYASVRQRQIEHERKPAPKVEDATGRTVQFTQDKSSK